MKIRIFAALLCVGISLVGYAASPVITVDPAFKSLVNAEAKENRIPWGENPEKYSVKLTGKLFQQFNLKSVVEGGRRYALTVYSFNVLKVLEGEWKDRELKLLVEHSLSTNPYVREKGVRFFREGEILTFKIIPEGEKYIVVSVVQ